VDKLPLEIVVHTLSWSGYSANAYDIAESIQRIDNVIDKRYFCRLEDEYKAKKYGVESTRMLKYLIQLKMEYEQRDVHNRPDSYLIEKELLEMADRVRESILRLSSEERKVIFFRFNRGLSAKKIAEKLKLDNQRRVYTLINKAIRKLRNFMLAEEDK
jgi:DNA-directed RNA polymerase specialized sigma24 family protein